MQEKGHMSNLHNRNRIPQAGTHGWRQREHSSFYKKGHFNCPSSLSQFTLRGPSGKFKRPRLNRLAPLWEVCTSQWMNPVSFITRGSRHHCETKQNWKNNTLHGQPTSPTSFIPPPPPPSEAGMLDQFVIQQAPSPSLKAPLNFGFLYPNPVLRLLKVGAAAHPSVCPHPNFSFHTMCPSTPTPCPPAIIFLWDKAQT